jgi:hypothetical protein
MISGSTMDEAAVLGAARRARAAADAAEVEVLVQTLGWASLHTVVDVDEAATWGDAPVPLAGPGAPLVSAFCVSEFAAALRMSPDAGRALIAHALEIGHRLPRVWHRVQAGDLPVWRARRIAEHTIPLSVEAAEYVDRQVGPFAHTMGPAAVERLVEEAIARHQPDQAAQIADRAADARHVRIEHQHVSFMGTSSITGELDLADALDLERALQHGAQQLADLGVDAHLDARRALALGHLARGDQALDLKAPAGSRQVVLYLHLSDKALGKADGVGRVENTGPFGPLVTADQIAAWCHIPATQVVVKPVIDLHDHLSTCAYEIPDRIREQIILRDHTCVFPWCTRAARRGDIDHITAWKHGPTSTRNLAALCRTHHRLKTFGGWTYSMIEPGTFLWRSPHGYRYLRDGTGTRDLTPRPVDPPGG